MQTKIKIGILASQEKQILICSHDFFAVWYLKDISVNLLSSWIH